MDVSARTTVRWEMGGVGRGIDGFEVDFGRLDNSFRCWRAIVRWNLHYRHYRVLLGNARDLLTKVIGEKLWRRS